MAEQRANNAPGGNAAGFLEDRDTRTRIGRRQERYLAQSAVLEEAGLPRLVRFAAIISCGGALTFMLWTGFATMDEVAKTRGEISPSGSLQIVQHLEGGIVDQILVDDGQLVEQGEPLVRLKAEEASAEYAQARSREATLMLQIAEKLALVSGHPLCESQTKEPERRAPITDCVGDDACELASSLALERIADAAFQMEYASLLLKTCLVLEAKRQAFLSQVSVLEAQLRQKRARRAKLNEQLKAYDQQVSIQDQEVNLREPLVKRNHMSRLPLLSAMQSRAATLTDRSEISGNLLMVPEEEREMRRKIRETRSNFKQQALLEVDGAVAELTAVRAQIPRLQDRLERLVVRAPLEGVIKDVQIKTSGGILPPGGTVAELVPFAGLPTAEVRISTEDVGHVRASQPVTIKVSTYDYARYGGITGELQSISPHTFQDEKTGEAYYKGVVQLSKDHVGENPLENRVRPGMIVDATIHTGSKTLLEYILKPIHSSMDESFSER
ncbi:HlyD family type I secretion periplasmic adaptor subunit [Magnetofaba australis]|uniref:Membrane fusion protein (MFP) family protein n=1 Tax=Magnetofaba australis IT-1 TaxID=1434232 RepID=A0A1Y2K0Y9_9PROT|nr:HlyD family type I secretion periplasmic adaptor subunit [Magnetofaba australis]OSM01720.1 putative HlyD family type I secretion membrane fusion protein [Magnetofaba australis IT-1]